MLNHDHAHGKCYYNEETVVQTSLNLLEYSENRNMEFGFLINRDDDKELYYRALAEPEKVVSSCLQNSPGDNKSLPSEKTIRSGSFNFDKFRIAELQDIEGEKGICIRCGANLSYMNGALPLCTKCYKSWVQFFNFDFPERFCHWCAKPVETSKRKPFCLECYRKYQRTVNKKSRSSFSQPVSSSIQNQTQSKSEAINVTAQFSQATPFGTSISEMHQLSAKDSNDIAEGPTADQSSTNSKPLLSYYRKLLLVIAIVVSVGIALEFIVNITNNKPQEVSRSADLKEIIRSYYKDIAKEPARIEPYFASNVDQFITVQNQTPQQIITLIEKDTKEFSGGKTTIYDSTFVMTTNNVGETVCTFWVKFVCFRSSKTQFQKCRVLEEFTFDRDHKITSIRELEVEDLEFSFSMPEQK